MGRKMVRQRAEKMSQDTGFMPISVRMVRGSEDAACLDRMAKVYGTRSDALRAAIHALEGRRTHMAASVALGRAEAAEKRAAAAERLSDRYGVFVQECGFLADIEVYSPDDLPLISERLGALRARAEAAEQRAEALAAEVARLRADALVLVGLARTAAIYDLNGPDTEAWGEALLLADGLSSADVAEVMRRVLRGVAESQPAEVSDV